jgi:cobyrinic acid a,c-diamide synthase
MGIPRLLIAGTHSGVGKTTISTGIMAALTARGMKVQGFKVGPDYIDPSYHTGATGRVSRNLDTWLLGDKLPNTFEQGVSGADIAIVEGVMGLFDGIKGKKEGGSSAHIAALLNIPVILIVDVRSMAYSAAAVVHGFASFDSNVKVAGVILNRVGSLSHFELVKDAVENLGIPVIGHLGREENLSLRERHLGLVPLGEEGCREDYFSDLAKMIEAGIDLERLIAIAIKNSSAGEKQLEEEEAPGTVVNSHALENCPPVQPEFQDIKITVAKDEAFSFYYQDALDLLKSLGAQISYFSPLHDHELPVGTDGIIIGGGFPESFLPELSANRALITSLQAACNRGIPIYAECGGLMYLCEKIVGFDQAEFDGAALVPGTCYMARKLQGMGYREGVTAVDSILGPEGTPVRGHEFHYSRIEYHETSNAYRLSTATGEDLGCEGFVRRNLLASYLHQNFSGNPDLAVKFLSTCKGNREARL